MKPTPDFSGWATRHNIKCSDGLTIRGGAFAHNDGAKIPLVWSHDHSSPESVLGHAVLENRPEGVYAYGYFNESDNGLRARELVAHGDLNSLSIFANKLVKKGNDVVHGQIRELSLVLSGANPGATIEHVNLAHSDDGTELMDAIICTNDILMHSSSEEFIQHEEENTKEKETTVAKEDDRTIQDVIDTMDEDQITALNYLVEQAAGAAEADEDGDFDPEYEDDGELEQSGLYYNEDGYLAHEGNYPMTGNVFENSGSYASAEPVLSHSAIADILNDAQKSKTSSLKDTFLAHAQTYGIENLDILFPDAKDLNGPQFLKRQTEWVTAVLDGVNKSPFSRIKSVVADITSDEARARGYIKGNKKKDEVLRLLKRETTPTTIYKKQKLDRDDVIDVRDLDIVAWLKAEMKLMLNEEIARAILFGDGRDVENESKIKEDHLRPIAKDVFPFTHTVNAVKADGYQELIKTVIRASENFKGSGTPAFYASHKVVTELLLLEDKMGRPLYDDITKLTTKLGVSKIVRIPDQIFKSLGDVFGIIVNLNDYTLGADKGGETTMFEDFDIDFNQMKYLMETRLCGCLTKPESALILKWGETAGVVTPEALTGPVIPEPQAAPAAGEQA